MSRGGDSVDGDPGPPSDEVDRNLALDGVVDAPIFDVPTMATDALAINPMTPSKKPAIH